MNKEDLDFQRNVNSIYRELNEVFFSKDNDYANSFYEVRKEFSTLFNAPSIILLFNKFIRFRTLLIDKYNNSDEYNNGIDKLIEDALLDLANYCVMEVAAMRIEKQINDCNNKLF